MGAPFDRCLVLDFETAWDRSSYTLSRMTTEEYIRDPRFKAWGACYKYLGEDAPPVWIPRAHLKQFFDSIDWSRTAVLAHNAQFDVAILSWVYGHNPCFIFDSLSMARALRGVEVGNSLARLAEEFGLPPKGTAVQDSNGYLDTLPFEVERELAEYCKHDVTLCEGVFNRLVVGYPAKELRLIDMTLRMFTNPVLELDADMLAKALEEERVRREGLLARLGVAEPDLASNPKFAEVLRALSIDPPQKVSKTTGETTWAFAKNDALFQALLNHDNEDVVLLCEARMSVKSTLERTRAQRFLGIAQRGTLPVPLNYYGAHTGRHTASKGMGLNLQNLKRGSFLRNAVMAPEGYVLVVGDLSQIEPRVLAHLSGYRALTQIFASGQDAYAAFGAGMFGVPGMTKVSHPVLRQSAKSALLGAGYQLGWCSFAAQLLVGFLGAPPTRYDKAFARQLGVTRDMLEGFLSHTSTEPGQSHTERALAIPRSCTDEEIIIHCVTAKRIIDVYRETAYPVTKFWKLCQESIEASLSGGRVHPHLCIEFRLGEIGLPNGMALRYPDLRAQVNAFGNTEWVYGGNKKLYGGKLTENIVQAVARIVMTDGMLRIQKRYPCVLTVHDEAVVLVPEREAEEAEAWVHAQMVQEPKYLLGIPLDAETGFNRRYGAAKK